MWNVNALLEGRTMANEDHVFILNILLRFYLTLLQVWTLPKMGVDEVQWAM